MKCCIYFYWLVKWILTCVCITNSLLIFLSIKCIQSSLMSKKSLMVFSGSLLLKVGLPVSYEFFPLCIFLRIFKILFTVLRSVKRPYWLLIIFVTVNLWELCCAVLNSDYHFRRTHLKELWIIWRYHFTESLSV